MYPIEDFFLSATITTIRDTNVFSPVEAQKMHLTINGTKACSAVSSVENSRKYDSLTRMMTVGVKWQNNFLSSLL
jgi:hypothetical protein